MKVSTYSLSHPLVNPWIKLGLLSALSVALLLAAYLVATPLYAQSDSQTVTATNGTEVDTSAISADEVNLIARKLWCPLCNGVRLDSCELQACAQMKDLIAIKLAEGEDLASIRTYFVAQYGPQVLGEPPLEGFNWLAWILPFAVLAAGGFFLLFNIKRMTRPVPVAAAVASSTGADPDAIPDEYEAKLAEELKRYG